MTTWQRINRTLYRARYAWQLRAARRRGRVALPVETAAPDANQPRILHVAWGRIGDAVLGTGTLRHFRAAFPGWRVVHLGRPETEPIVGPLVDEFVPFDARAWQADADARRALARTLSGPWSAIVSDLHLFYGGTAELGAMLGALDAPHKILYEGYDTGPGLAPIADVPHGFDVVPTRPRDGTIEDRHLTRDAAYYLAAITERIRGIPFAPPDTRPSLDHLGLTPTAGLDDAIAWQPFANNRKKDFPADRWRAALENLPTQRFVALGGAEDRATVEALNLPNVDNRCGRTTLLEAASILAGARGFVGPDSGLTHIATALGCPTVCVSQSANLGYFFPYTGFENLEVVRDPRFEACSGCFMTCAHESIATTARRGALCVRQIAPEAVVDAIRRIPSKRPVEAVSSR